MSPGSPLALYGVWVMAALGELLSWKDRRKAVTFLALGIAAPGTAELLAQRYGLFGAFYAYDPKAWSGPLYLALPALVPLMWLAGLTFSYRLAHMILKSPAPLRVAALGASLMTLWDLALDPLSVAQGLWSWSGGSHLYHGIPLENFVSWWLGTFGVFLLAKALRLRPSGGSQLAPLAYAALGAYYFATSWSFPGLAMLGVGLSRALSRTDGDRAATHPRGPFDEQAATRGALSTRDSSIPGARA